MADPVALDTWAGTDVVLSKVIDTLIDLRHTSARTFTRTMVMTLVVVATNDDDAYRATQAMHALGTHHPARMIVLQPQADVPQDGVDARVTLFGTAYTEHPIAFEEVVLVVRGAACAALDSIIEPFTMSDLPLVLWYPGSLPPMSDCLLPTADTVLVDLREAPPDPALVELARRRGAVDLSWARLAPWRELLAGLFDHPRFRPFVTGVTSIEVEGKPGARRLLAGWLASRLQPQEPTIRLVDAQHAGIRMRATHDGERASFAVVRDGDERAVRGTASIDGGPVHREVLPLPDDSLVWSLAQALTHLRRDSVWQEALEHAVLQAP